MARYLTYFSVLLKSYIKARVMRENDITDRRNEKRPHIVGKAWEY